MKHWIKRASNWAMVVVVVTGLGVVATPAYAQEDPPERQTKKAEALSKGVYDKLTKAQEFVDAENWGEANKIVRGMLSGTLTNFERANVLNFSGFIEYSRGNVDGALRAYEQLIGIPEVEPQMRLQTTYTIAQLYATKEQWRKSIQYLDMWFKDATNPPPEAYVLLAQAYSQIEEFGKMISPLDTAIAEAKRRGTEVKEDWYNLKYYACYQLEQYNCVRDTLKILAAGWPKKNYWMALGGIYSELNEERNMLAVYEAMYTAGALTSGTELVTMAQLYLQGNVPYKAAKVLEDGMQSGVISQDAKNYRLLSQAWSLAAEDMKAIPALREAARLSSDGDLNASLAISYLNTDQYAECVEAGREGIRKGGLKRPGDSYITVGMCLYNMDRLTAAKSAFRSAAEDSSSEKIAGQWVKVIDSDLARLEQLRLARQALKKDQETEEESSGDTEAEGEVEANADATP